MILLKNPWNENAKLRIKVDKQLKNSFSQKRTFGFSEIIKLLSSSY